MENYCEEQLLIMRNDKEFYNGKNHLVIVESPAKVKTIKNFWAAIMKWRTLPGGHVRDLPKSQLGFDKGTRL